MCSNETKTEKAGEKMVCKLKTIRADMLVLQCQLERELIRYVKRYLCQPQVTIITMISSLPLCASCTTMWRIRSFRLKW